MARKPTRPSPKQAPAGSLRALPRTTDPFYEDDDTAITSDIRLHEDGTPEVRRQCLLRVVRGPGTGETVTLGQRTVRVGRAPDCGLRLQDPSASRRHFEVCKQQEHHVIRDLRSTNGTLVNDTPIVECRLANGDLITVGEICLVFLEETEVHAPGDGP